MIFKYLIILMILASGVSIWNRLSDLPNLLETFIFGPVIALTLISFGLVIENIFGIYGIRYIPVVGIILLLILHRSKQIRKTFKLFPNKIHIGDITVVLLTTALTVPAILGSFHASLTSSGSSNPKFSYWLYGDLQYYWSLASESISKYPAVFPSSLQDHLQYTWLFHTTIGSISDLTGISTNRLLFNIWPIFFSYTAILSIYVIALKLTDRKYIAIVGVVFFEIFRGPLLPSQLNWITPGPIHSLSPHRDFATLLLLAMILLIINYKKLRPHS